MTNNVTKENAIDRIHQLEREKRLLLREIIKLKVSEFSGYVSKRIGELTKNETYSEEIDRMVAGAQLSTQIMNQINEHFPVLTKDKHVTKN